MKVVPKGYKLFPFQKEGVVKLIKILKKRRRALLADVPGLGKTCQALVISNAVKSKKLVVATPACLVYNWVDELAMWDVGGRRAWVYDGPKSLDAYDGQEVIVCSYASLEKLSGVLGGEYDLFADEYHYCSNWGTNRTKNTIELIKGSRYFLGITGTPMSNGVSSLHSLVYPIGGSKLFPKDYHEFCEKYSTPTWDGYRTVYEGVRNEKELKSLIRQFMVRRYKKQVFDQLPDKMYIKQFIDIGDKAAASLEYASMFDIMEKRKNPNREIDPAYAKVRKQLGLDKVPGTAEAISNLLLSGTKHIVCFSHHRQVNIELAAILEKKYKRRVALIIGGDSKKEVNRKIKEFQNGEYDAVCASLRAVNTGVTMTRANAVMFCEPDSIATVVSQAIDRVHRIGQDRGVRVYFSLAKDSLDERVFKAMKKNLKITNKVFGQ